MTAALNGEASFCVNLLATRHHALVPVYAGKAKGRARFEHGEWRAAENGLPVLADASASLLCLTHNVVPAATHNLFIGQVTGITVHSEIDPFLWVDGMFALATRIERPDGTLP